MWIPGGKIPNENAEAIFDAGKIPLINLAFSLFHFSEVRL
jgi:hypothetical protein